jgi:hypothetical protein
MRQEVVSADHALRCRRFQRQNALSRVADLPCVLMSSNHRPIVMPAYAGVHRGDRTVSAKCRCTILGSSLDIGASKSLNSPPYPLPQAGEGREGVGAQRNVGLHHLLSRRRRHCDRCRRVVGKIPGTSGGRLHHLRRAHLSAARRWGGQGRVPPPMNDARRCATFPARSSGQVRRRGQRRMIRRAKLPSASDAPLPTLLRFARSTPQGPRSPAAVRPVL